MTGLDQVVILAGGLSPEREVSLRSGNRVRDELTKLDVDAVVLDADAALLTRLAAHRPTAVFPAIHGSCGEDGSIREVLDLLSLPYVGSAPSACRSAFDKPTAKSLVAAAGVATPASVTLPRETFHDLGASAVIELIVARLGLPLYVKPSRGGSSLGAGAVRRAADLPAALLSCFAYGDTALIEQLIQGTEVAVGVVDLGSGAQALPPVEIVPGEGGYDYSARYTAGQTEFYVPARLPEHATRAIAEAALTAHTVLGLRDLSRTDLMVDASGTAFFMESNVSPGMTETSTFPLALEASGHAFGDTCRRLLELAAARAGLAEVGSGSCCCPTLVSMTQRKSFGSDNHAGVHPAVLQAMLDANTGDVVAYGADDWTARAVAALRSAFRCDGEVFFVFNGSGANILGLSTLLRRHSAVICAESAHINTDECGSAERLLGTKLLQVASPDGKLTPELIAPKLDGRGDDHRAQAGVVAVTQSTELGTCYTLEELRKISDFCHASDLLVYLDGARLANAAAYLDCTLADIAECADVLSFGGTKNGALGAEALIVMRPDLVDPVQYLRKQQTQLASKMRFVAAQFLALMDAELWRANAAHANAMARRLAAGVRDVPEVSVVHPVQANAVFARVGTAQIKGLQKDWVFHTWDESVSMVRWMCAFDTSEEDVDWFVADVRGSVRFT